MVILYFLGVALIIFTISYIVVMEVEHEKQKRNPIPKKDNSDKRFCKIKNIYSHKIFEIKRGN